MAENFEYHPPDKPEGNLNQPPPLPKERSTAEYVEARTNLLAVAERDVNDITSVERLVEVHRTTGMDLLTVVASQGALEYHGQTGLFEPYVYVLRHAAGNALFRLWGNANFVRIEKFDDKSKVHPTITPGLINTRSTTGFDIQLPSQEPLYVATRDFRLGVGATIEYWHDNEFQSLHPFWNSDKSPTYPDDIRHYARLLKEGVTGILPKLAEPEPPPSIDLPPINL
jgi:hypothetical protein